MTKAWHHVRFVLAIAALILCTDIDDPAEAIQRFTCCATVPHLASNMRKNCRTSTYCSSHGSRIFTDCTVSR